MKLYEIPKGSTIQCKTSDDSEFITFHKIDGMYSYCTTEKGNAFHLGAVTELERQEDGTYIITQLP